MPAQMQAARQARYVADPANAESQGQPRAGLAESLTPTATQPCEGRWPACALSGRIRAQRAVPSRWFPRVGIMRSLWAIRVSIRTTNELLE
jgi:hypothetical protein